MPGDGTGLVNDIFEDQKSESKDLTLPIPKGRGVSSSFYTTHTTHHTAHWYRQDPQTQALRIHPTTQAQETRQADSPAPDPHKSASPIQ